MEVEARIAQANGSSAVVAKRYAVVVGINDYSESDANDLLFCVPDAEAFYEALITYCKYDPAYIFLFSDGTRPHTYIDATRGRSIPQEFIAYHVVPVVKKETPFQNTFAETRCGTMMLGEVVLPLVASMYV